MSVSKPLDIFTVGTPSERRTTVNERGSLMSHHPNIRVERDEHVVTVTIDRPEAKNACTGDMWVAIGATFRDRVLGRAGIGAHGRGRQLLRRRRPQAGGSGGRPAPPGTMVDAMRVLGRRRARRSTLSGAGRRQGGRAVRRRRPRPRARRRPDLVLGSGRFSAIFAKRGLSLDFGTSWLLRQRIGVHKAKELAFTAKMVSGPRRSSSAS